MGYWLRCCPKENGEDTGPITPGGLRVCQHLPELPFRHCAQRQRGARSGRTRLTLKYRCRCRVGMMRQGFQLDLNALCRDLATIVVLRTTSRKASSPGPVKLLTGAVKLLSGLGWSKNAQLTVKARFTQIWQGKGVSLLLSAWLAFFFWKRLRQFDVKPEIYNTWFHTEDGGWSAMNLTVMVHSDVQYVLSWFLWRFLAHLKWFELGLDYRHLWLGSMDQCNVNNNKKFGHFPGNSHAQESYVIGGFDCLNIHS